MSDFNPYAIPDDIDDDLLGQRTPRKHDVEGRVCPSCGIVHDIDYPEDVPQEVLDQLSVILDGIPQELLRSKIIVAKSTPNRTRVISDFVDFARTVDDAAQEVPLLRAVAEVLDDMTGGQVERRWRVYQAERLVITTHIILKAVNTMVDGLQTKLKEAKTTDKDSETLFELLENLRTATMDRLHGAADRYRQAAEDNGVEIDEALIECGMYSDTHSGSRFTETMEQMTKVNPEEDPDGLM